MTKTPMKTAAYVIPLETYERIRAIADRDGVAQSKVMRDVLEMALDARESIGMPTSLPKLNLDHE